MGINGFEEETSTSLTVQVVGNVQPIRDILLGL